MFHIFTLFHRTINYCIYFIMYRGIEVMEGTCSYTDNQQTKKNAVFRAI